MKKAHKNAMGQIVISDLIISLAIFLMILVIAYQAWNQQIERISEWRTQARAADALRRSLDSITNSPGHPSNWHALNKAANESDILSIGAAANYGVIDPLKLQKMAEWLNSQYYNATLLKMGLGTYQLSASVNEMNGTVIYSMGQAPSGEAIILSSGQRLAVYQGRAVLVRVVLWRS